MSLLEVPEDALRNVAMFLSAPDVMNVLTAHRRFHELSSTESFWRCLTQQLEPRPRQHPLEMGANDNEASGNEDDNRTNEDGVMPDVNPMTPAQARREYLTRAYANELPLVEWKPCVSSRTSPTGREGHIACRLGTKVIITGGFTDDDLLFVLETKQTNNNNNENLPQRPQHDWLRILPETIEPHINHNAHLERLREGAGHQNNHPRQNNNNIFGGRRLVELVDDLDDMEDDNGNGTVNRRPSNVYGASLTPLDHRRAVRFGGFCNGGYSGECAEVCLLTLDERTEEEEREADHRADPNSRATSRRLKATWQVIETEKEPLPGGLARAYHSATLVAGRYLVVLGGMRSSGSIRGEAILDTQTWTWIDQPITQEMKHPKPGGRHGHSVVLDEKRNRLVLFGGGSGSDLLRSGTDNAEVWELAMGPRWNSPHNAKKFMDSLPWEWGLIHDNAEDSSEEESESESSAGEPPPLIRRDEVDAPRPREEPQPDMEDDEPSENNEMDGIDGDSDDESHDSMPELIRRTWRSAGRGDGNRASTGTSTQLSEAEKLCLGRCHMGYKVGPDTAILVFGSGRPSTNRLLGYRLSSDTFFRPKFSNPMLPPPRFTAAGVLFGDSGDCNSPSYLLVHGGYSSQEGVAIGNMCVLDLAPALQRPFTALPIDTRFVSSRLVSHEDIGRFGGGFGRFGQGIGDMEDLLFNLFAGRAQMRVRNQLQVRQNQGQMGGIGFDFGQAIGEGFPGFERDDSDEDDSDDEDANNEEGDDESDTDESDPDMPQLVARMWDDESSDGGDDEGDTEAALMFSIIGNNGPIFMPGPMGRLHEDSDDDDDDDNFDNLSEVS